MLRVQTLKKTCDSCPAQWHGRTDDGRQVYVRYRSGYLSVRVAVDQSDGEFAGVRGEEVYGAQLGDGLDGYLSMDDLRSATADVVAWP